MKWHSDDVALIEVDTKFELTEKVEPVCVDWNNLYEGTDMQYNKTGVVRISRQNKYLILHILLSDR